MATSTNWPVAITTVGASKGGSVVFRQDGKLHVTCVLKSTFKLVPDEAMKLVHAEDLFCAEMHYRDNPSRSIRATSDAVPYLPRVDVVLTGFARAPQGQKVTSQRVSLGVYHSIALLEKVLEVHGDLNGPEIVPFESMPLIYERALGGLGDAQNPYGTGKAPGSAPPNILYPNDPNAVAGFGPISRALRQRKMLLGNVSPSALSDPIIELPSDFDWSYFQAAPPDQQLASLVGNEWIVIEGMHPVHRRIASRLPTVRPIATIFGIDPAKPDATISVQARLDMLRIDADKLTCSVIGRAVVRIEDECSLETVRIVAAVETEDHSYAHMLSPPTAGAGRVNTTVQVSPKVDAQRGGEGTLVLGDSSGSTSALPFAQKFDIEDEGTIDMDIASHHEGREKPVMPFAADALKKPLSKRATPIPGAPWSPVPVRKMASLSFGESTLADSHAQPRPPIDEPTRKFVRPSEFALFEPPQPPPAPPAPVPAPPPAAPSAVFTTPSTQDIPAPAKSDAPPKDFYAKTGSELPLVTPKPPPPRIPAKPAVNKSIYGGFGPPKKKT